MWGKNKQFHNSVFGTGKGNTDYNYNLMLSHTCISLNFFNADRFVASNNCFHQAIVLQSDGSVSTSIYISPSSALIVLPPRDCRAVVRMLVECCWMHKGDIWTAECLLLPFSLSKLLLWLKAPNFRMCRNKTNCANLCIACCGSRDLAARDRASLYSAHAQSASSDWWSIHRVCVWAP